MYFYLNPDYNPRKDSINGILYDEEWGNGNILPRDDDESHGTHVAGIIAGRKLNRKSSHRIALLKNLSKSLIIHEQIETTLPKAKDLRPFVEKILTIVKTNSLAAKRKVYSYLGNKKLVKCKINEVYL